MEEEKIGNKSKTTGRKTKKETNERMLDVLQRLEQDDESKENKETEKKKKTTTSKNTTKNTEKKTTNKKDITESVNKEKAKQPKKTVEKKENKASKKEEIVEEKNETKTEIEKEIKKEIKPKKIKEIQKTTEEKEIKEKVLKPKKEKNNKLKKKDVKAEEEIKKQTQISEEKKKEIYGKTCFNLIVAILVFIYFITIDVLFLNLSSTIFAIVVKVLSVILITITVGIFEYAYKKESGKITITGIEMLITSLITLFLERISIECKGLFVIIVGIIPLVFCIYYIVKTIIVYVKIKKEAYRQISDIYDIVKKEKKKIEE